MIASVKNSLNERSRGAADGRPGLRTVDFPAITAFRLPAGPAPGGYPPNADRKPNGDPSEVMLWGGASRR